MLKDLNVAYIGTVYPHHARADLLELKEMGCTSINMCLNEADWMYYRFSRHEIRRVAKELGMKVILNMHGFGSFAATFPGSMYQMKHPDAVQVSNKGDKHSYFACPNNQPYREWLFSNIAEIIHEMAPDGIMWDEPQFDSGEKYPEEWSCYCESCQRRFELDYGLPMPKEMSNEVIEFRQNTLLTFLGDLTRAAKQLLPEVENVLCLMAQQSSKEGRFVKGYYGIVDWEPFVALDSIDVFAVDPYWIHHSDWSFFNSNTQDAIKLSHKYGKECQIWVQSIWIEPGKEHLIGETIHRAEQLGADRIAVWAYRGESGSHFLNMGAQPDDCWAEVVTAYKEIAAKAQLRINS